MVTTINAYSVSLGLDASSFIDSSKLSRSEVAKLKKDIEQARDPMEQMAVEQDRLKKALDAGAISLQVYNRLLEEKRRKLLGVQQPISAYQSALTAASKVGNVVTGVQAGFQMVAGVISTANQALESFVEVGARIDDVADKAANLGMSFNDLGALRFAAKEMGGEGALGAIDAAVGKMMKEGFVDPGESAVDAFKRIAGEIRGIADPAERVQRATEVFGKSGVELVGMLSQGGDELERSLAYWEKTNALTEAQVLTVGEFGDNMDRITLALEGATNIVFANLAPAINIVLRDIIGLSDGMDSFRSGVDTATVGVVAMSGYLKDAKDILMGSIQAANPFAMFQEGYGSQLQSGLEMDSASQAAQKLGEERLRLSMEAAEKMAKREKDLEDARIQAKANKEKELQESLAKQRIDDDRKRGEAEWELAKQEIEREKKARDIAEREIKQTRDRNMSILQSVYKQIEEENKRGPATAVFGTSEYTKAFAQAMNKNNPAAQPTDQQILAKAQEQLKTQQAQDAKLGQLLTATGELTTAVKDNGFRRIN